MRCFAWAKRYLPSLSNDGTRESANSCSSDLPIGIVLSGVAGSDIDSLTLGDATDCGRFGIAEVEAPEFSISLTVGDATGCGRFGTAEVEAPKFSIGEDSAALDFPSNGAALDSEAVELAGRLVDDTLLQSKITD